MADRYSERKPGWATVSPTTGDRILVGGCAAVWLVLVGMSVAAVVALVDLGRGFHKTAGNPHTSSVLYVIIVVSALIILAAIPMLLRARRTTRAEPVARSTGLATPAGGGQPIRPGHPPARGVAEQARTERLTALRPALPDAEVNRIWLRGSVFLLGAMGLALVAVAAATYLMAIGHQGAAWTAYVIAGVVAVVMPLVLWRHVRRLRRTLTEPQPSY
ncbi:DUF2561 family protein [Mycobacterium sp.]|uniref:DUF2561 family protein n=1 Tax=Mycobacterium sp. TaxID=1785 RepID=UPI003D6BA0EC